ncbi:hypothetical protein HRED_08528 [Candidatus Haloredivivus sp. G17]|nr:hypothetical protein HRED_08528 [Candidatus Haloredivivus sp. G17]
MGEFIHGLQQKTLAVQHIASENDYVPSGVELETV